jgi:hypothetical protein
MSNIFSLAAETKERWTPELSGITMTLFDTFGDLTIISIWTLFFGLICFAFHLNITRTKASRTSQKLLQDLLNSTLKVESSPHHRLLSQGNRYLQFVASQKIRGK